MGDVYVRIGIANPSTGAKSKPIRALADTGATLTILPARLLEKLGIEPSGTANFEMADGRMTTRRVGNAMVTINGESAPSRVVFGRLGDSVLLGVTVLEQLGLAVDPVRRRLIPAPFRF
ncbi:MAG: retroviral-like aspartic protease family protein [Candidatus Rokubacteria bacterium]|nr:retroviral-like aspartic protease family protein [Candidatus Rokubacteria bacterium]